MRVNEVISLCRTDQSVIIHYDNRSIVCTVHEIIDVEEYRLNRVGDMIVTNIISNNSDLWLKAVKP
mgnify:CR=1 FL=1